MILKYIECSCLLIIHGSLVTCCCLLITTWSCICFCKLCGCHSLFNGFVVLLVVLLLLWLVAADQDQKFWRFIRQSQHGRCISQKLAVPLVHWLVKGCHHLWTNPYMIKCICIFCKYIYISKISQNHALCRRCFAFWERFTIHVHCTYKPYVHIFVPFVYSHWLVPCFLCFAAAWMLFKAGVSLNHLSPRLLGGLWDLTLSKPAIGKDGCCIVYVPTLVNSWLINFALSQWQFG